VKPELIELLCCTECRAFPLEVAATKTEGAEIIDGALVCTACKRRYPIEDAIPVMLPDAIREISPEEKAKWMEVRRQLEAELIDADHPTYKERFRELAKKEGLDEARDGYLWEVRLYEDTIAKWGQHWEDVPEALGVKWARDEVGERFRNTATWSYVRGVEGDLTGRKVLNLGSGGDVDIIQRMERDGAMVVSSDIVPGALKHLRRSHGGASFQGVCADLARLPFRDGAFDHVLCVEVIHHVQPIDRGTTEVARVTRVGGRAYLVEVNDKHLFTIPGRVLPKFIKRMVRGLIGLLFKTKARYLEGSPYEKITSISEFATSLERSGLRQVTVDAVVHPPGVFPERVMNAWQRLAKRMPWFFNPIGFEYVLFGTKPAPSN